MEISIINTDIVSTEWRPITGEPSRSMRGESFSINVRSGSPFKFADNAASNASFVTVDGALSLNSLLVGSDGVIGYAKATEATDVAETVVVR